MATYRILALDGGGIRGLYTAILLNRLAKEVPGFTNRADLLAGTSTGGILALGLAWGIPVEALIYLYKNRGAGIFARGAWHELRDLGDLVGAKYDNKDLVHLARVAFGNSTLDDLLPRHVLVPTFDLDNQAKPPNPRMWKPKFFHNFAGPDSDGAQKIADVVLRTSAAPTYFPVYQGCVDGGVIANNPSMAAVAQALDAGTGKQQLNDLRVFSVGTGITPAFVEGDAHNWGLAQWAPVLADMMLEGGMGVADYECARLLGQNYFRLAPVLPNPVPLDSVDKIPELIEYANRVDIASAVAWLKVNF
ncbi:MAG: patatin-like phospholipase family protein [Candidatus Acidiferrales bacterium]